MFNNTRDSISVEFAMDMGWMPSPLDGAYKMVEGLSILSRPAEEYFESSYLRAQDRIYRKYKVDPENLTVKVSVLNSERNPEQTMRD